MREELDFWFTCTTCYFLGIFWTYFFGMEEAVIIGAAVIIFAIILYYGGFMKNGKR